MSRFTVAGAIRFYTPAEAAVVLQTSRFKIDAACESGALKAVDDVLPTTASRSEKPKRRWRIREDRLLEWDDNGRPIVPPT